MRIAALSTGVGNIWSVLRALERAVPTREQITATADPDVVRRADVIVVPGQGSFGAFAAAIDREGLRDVLIERVRSGTPYFGICLGLQILFEASEEAPESRGLGVFPGTVRRLDPGIDPEGDGVRQRPLPHIGWNWVATMQQDDPILTSDFFYFAHSYAISAKAEATAATTEYGETFASAIRKDNIVGVQFHPEKSQRAGLRLIERFFASLKTPTPTPAKSG